MQQFVVGQPVSLTVELSDAGGAPVTPTSVRVTFYDQAGDVLEVQQPTPAQKLIIAPAVQGVLPKFGGESRSAIIEYVVQGMPGTNYRSVEWVLLAGVRVGVNTSMSVAVANTFAPSDLAAWHGASDADKEWALLAAYRAMASLKMPILGRSAQGCPLNLFDDGFPIKTLPERFVGAFRLAQVLEADTLLGGEEEASKRASGVLSETIGESSMMFRPGKALDFGVSPRTLRALRGYVDYSVRIGRG